MYTLNELSPGEAGLICRVHGSGLTLNRLLALGFTPGTQVTCLFSAPLGDPVVFRLRGSTLAVGRVQAGLVELAKPSGKKEEKGRAFLPL